VFARRTGEFFRQYSLVGTVHIEEHRFWFSESFYQRSFQATHRHIAKKRYHGPLAPVQRPLDARRAFDPVYGTQWFHPTRSFTLGDRDTITPGLPNQLCEQSRWNEGHITR